MGSNPIARSLFNQQWCCGDVAKWEGSGLQNRDHGFKSRRRLWAKGLVAARCLALSAVSFLCGAVAEWQTLRT